MIRKFLSILLSFILLPSCSTNEPATIERKDNLYYRHDGTVKIEKMKKGESLDKLAVRYGVAASEIARINSLPRNFTSLKGRDILIPINKNQNLHYLNDSNIANINDKMEYQLSDLEEEKIYQDNVVESEPLTISQDKKSYEANFSYKSKAEEPTLEKNSTVHKKSSDEKVSNISSQTKNVKDLKNNKDTSQSEQKNKKEIKPIVVKNVDLNSLDDSKPKEESNNKDDLKIEKEQNNSNDFNDNSSPSLKKEGFKLSYPLNDRNFMWPVQGEVIKRFNKQQGIEGMNISASANTIVRAIGNGKVIYVGNSVNQYGHLIIIRHENDYLSAYAHNEGVTVKKGQQIKKGQAIAKVGQSGDVDKPQLYFAMRKGKEVIDPESAR